MQFQLTTVSPSGGTPICFLAHFPFVVGRGSECDLTVTSPGVFTRHVELRPGETGLIEITPLGDALVLVDDRPVNGYRLKNGERFRCGSAEFQFGLVPSKLRKLAGKEALFWLSAATLASLQFFLAWRM